MFHGFLVTNNNGKSILFTLLYFFRMCIYILIQCGKFAWSMKCKHILRCLINGGLCILCIVCCRCSSFSVLHCYIFCLSIHRPLLIISSAFSMRLWIRPKARKIFYNWTLLSTQTQQPNNLTIFLRTKYSNSSIFSISILCQHSILWKWYISDKEMDFPLSQKKIIRNIACSVFNCVYMLRLHNTHIVKRYTYINMTMRVLNIYIYMETFWNPNKIAQLQLPHSFGN